MLGFVCREQFNEWKELSYEGICVVYFDKFQSILFTSSCLNYYYVTFIHLVRYYYLFTIINVTLVSFSLLRVMFYCEVDAYSDKVIT